MKIALTQSEGRLGTLAEALAAQGHEVVRVPLVRTDTLLTEEARAAAETLAGADWLLFSSRSGVRAWHVLGFDLTGGPRLGAVGEATASSLRKLGGRVDLVGDPPSAVGLAASFLERVGSGRAGLERAGSQGFVGLPQGARALPTLQERLEAGGVRVRTAVIYETKPLPWPVSGPAGLDAVLLASPSAVEALPARVALGVRLLSLGPSTSRAVRARGWRCTEVGRPDAAAVLEAVASLKLPGTTCPATTLDTTPPDMTPPERLVKP